MPYLVTNLNGDILYNNGFEDVANYEEIVFGIDYINQVLGTASHNYANIIVSALDSFYILELTPKFLVIYRTNNLDGVISQGLENEIIKNL